MLGDEVTFKVELRLVAVRTVLRKQVLETFETQASAERFFEWAAQRTK